MPQRTHLTTVRRVIDGDSLTIWIDKEVREVRLYGIDAPEHGQQGADESRNALRQMLGGQTFWAEHQHDDPYGRMVCLLYHQDRRRRDSVNLRLVREGYAYAYTKYGGEELGFRQAEADARQGRRGLWRDSRDGGERPWNYRHRNRRGQEKSNTGYLMLILGIITFVVVAAIMNAILS